MVEGLLLAEDEVIRNVVPSFFEHILKDDMCWDKESVDSSLEVIPQIFNEQLDKNLTTIPSSIEVKDAVSSFKGNKALGPNDFPLFFFNLVILWSWMLLMPLRIFLALEGCSKS